MGKGVLGRGVGTGCRMCFTVARVLVKWFAGAWRLLHCSQAHIQANGRFVDTNARFRNVPKIVLWTPGAVHEDAPLYLGRGSE